jgi:hypothetical protein
MELADMTEEDFLILIHFALVEIRMLAQDQKNFAAIAKLADLFHNLPLQLNHYHQVGHFVEQIGLRLDKKAEDLCIGRWLENAIEKNLPIMKQMKEKSSDLSAEPAGLNSFVRGQAPDPQVGHKDYE